MSNRQPTESQFRLSEPNAPTTCRMAMLKHTHQHAAAVPARPSGCVRVTTYLQSAIWLEERGPTQNCRAKLTAHARMASGEEIAGDRDPNRDYTPPVRPCGDDCTADIAVQRPTGVELSMSVAGAPVLSPSAPLSPSLPRERCESRRHDLG